MTEMLTFHVTKGILPQLDNQKANLKRSLEGCAFAMGLGEMPFAAPGRAFVSAIEVR